MEQCCYEAGSGEDHLEEPLASLLLSVNSDFPGGSRSFGREFINLLTDEVNLLPRSSYQTILSLDVLVPGKNDC